MALTNHLGLGLFPRQSMAAALIGSATVLNDTTPTFTRATSAYDPILNAIVGAGVRRRRSVTIDHNSLSMDLIEGARTNLLAAGTSEHYARWTLVNSPTVVDGAATAPDGTLTASTIQDASAVAFTPVRQVFTVANDGLSHCFSIYVLKTSGGTSATVGITLALTGGTPVSVNPRLNADTGANSGSYSVDDAGAYWRLVGKLTNNTSGNTTLTLSFFCAAGPYQASPLSANDAASAVGTATVWGAMLEKAEFPSSYISNRNLLLQTEVFGTTWVLANSTITSNSVADPLTGNITADTMVETTGNGVHTVSQSFTKAASSLTFTGSIYYKNAAGTRNLWISLDDGTTTNGGNAVLGTDGTTVLAANVVGAGFSAPSVVTTSLGSGWYRAALTMTSSTAVTIRLRAGTASGTSSSFVGDTANSLYFFGAQLEYGTSATAYWCVASVIGARAADVLSCAKALDTVNGTVLAIYIPNGWSDDQDGASTYQIWCNDDNAAPSRITRNAATTLFVGRRDGGIESTTFTRSITNGTMTQTALVYDATSVRAFQAGAAIGTPDSSLTPPYLAGTNCFIGSNASSLLQFYGWVAVPYWDRALIAGELLAISQAATA